MVGLSRLELASFGYRPKALKPIELQAKKRALFNLSQLQLIKKIGDLDGTLTRIILANKLVDSQLGVQLPPRDQKMEALTGIKPAFVSCLRRTSRAKTGAPFQCSEQGHKIKKGL